MPKVLRLELMCVDLPFRHAFRHAAATRQSSESLFLKCVTDTGAIGFGESLPRKYVTGETRDSAFELLHKLILPELAGREFGSLAELREFLILCDGKAPPNWIPARTPQLAAWCAVELALLDAFGRAFSQPVRATRMEAATYHVRYGGVTSASAGWKRWASLLKLRAYGLKDIKLKVGTGDVVSNARLARRIMGGDTTLRVDANMAWSTPEALKAIPALHAVGAECVEQPVAADDLEGQSRLVRETQVEIIADESFGDRESLQRLVSRHACTGVNVRISKCGGLIAATRRCSEALQLGLTLQVGCQVGESSLLSAAQLILISSVPEVKYLEGCFGEHLLREDPAVPCLQFGYGGRPPRLPDGPGLGVTIDESRLNRWVSRRAVVEAHPKPLKEKYHVTCS